MRSANQDPCFASRTSIYPEGLAALTPQFPIGCDDLCACVGLTTLVTTGVLLVSPLARIAVSVLVGGNRGDRQSSLSPRRRQTLLVTALGSEGVVPQLRYPPHIKEKCNE